MKTLIINGRYLSQPVTGVQRYAREVVEAWDNDIEKGRIDGTQYTITVIAPRGPWKDPGYRHIRVIESCLRGRLWEQIELPLRSMGKMLFSPYAAAPVLKRRQIVTIHDGGVVATPEQYSRLFRAYYSVVYRCLGVLSKKILTVSEFSRSELHRYFLIPLKKIVVIPPGCDHLMKHAADPRILSRFGLEPGRFVLGVSSQSPIKNFDGLASAWKLLNRSGMKLAIAGKQNSRIFRSSGPRPDTGVTWLGYVSDSELRALYESAALFAYPSFYEGFGIPPVEAMTCGCPALVARTSALPESCGEGALYCDPSSPQDIAFKIASVLDDPELGKKLRAAGLQRSRLFTIRNTASRVWLEIQSFL